MSETQTNGMRPFTFRYRKQATARIGPIETVTCEGIEFSDGIVSIKEEKAVHCYGSLDEIYAEYVHHGKGAICFAIGAQEQHKPAEKAVSECNAMSRPYLLADERDVLAIERNGSRQVDMRMMAEAERAHTSRDRFIRRFVLISENARDTEMYCTPVMSRSDGVLFCNGTVALGYDPIDSQGTTYDSLAAMLTRFRDRGRCCIEWLDLEACPPPPSEPYQPDLTYHQIVERLYSAPFRSKEHGNE